MLYELEKKDYSLLEPMLISGFQFPEVSAVVDSINSGWIVTNDPEHPASALMWAEGLGGFFLLGLCGKLIRVLYTLGTKQRAYDVNEVLGPVRQTQIRERVA